MLVTNKFNKRIAVAYPVIRGTHGTYETYGTPSTVLKTENTFLNIMVKSLSRVCTYCIFVRISFIDLLFHTKVVTGFDNGHHF